MYVWRSATLELGGFLETPIVIDIAGREARTGHLPDASRLLSGFTPLSGHIRKSESISKFTHGGARENSGGARAGAGRPRAAPVSPAVVQPHWYVARAVHGQTDLADDEIRAAGFEVVTAKLCRPATRARRSASGSLVRAREEQFLPLFVRYIIVRFSLADPGWHDIPAMDSVERIICGGHVSNGGVGIPIAIPDPQIDKLRKILSPAGVWFPPGYRARTDDEDPFDVGTRLELPDGAMAGHAGVCAMSDGQRIEMLMGWFNRDNTRTSVAHAKVAVAKAPVDTG